MSTGLPTIDRSDRGARPRLRTRLADSRNLNLLRELTISQFRLKDQSSFFGLLWSVLNPVLMVTILFAFFAHRFAADVDHYGAYLLLGMVQYTHFANATNNSMRTLLTMRQLTRETVFPKELLVVSSTLSNTIDFVIAMGIAVLTSYAMGVTPRWAHLILPVVVIAQFLLVTWVSLILACIYPLARDLEHIYQVFLRAMMFVTPIFYSASFLQGSTAELIMALNPLAHLLDLSRSALIQGTLPSAPYIATVLLVNVVLTLGSVRLFRALEPRIAEYV